MIATSPTPTRPRNLALLSVLALAPACEGVLEHGGPSWRDYSGPGASGEDIGEPAGPAISVTTVPELEELPETQECGDAYEIVSSARRSIETCEGAPHLELYHQVREDAQQYGDSIECPEGCSCDHWITAHEWSCDEDKGVAQAGIQVTAACFPDGSEGPDSLAYPPKEHFYENMVWTLGDFAVSPFDHMGVSAAGETSNLPCGTSTEAQYKYRAPVESCEDVDYEGHVEAGVSGAEIYHSTFDCIGACLPKAFVDKGRAWGCEDGVVEVTVSFDVVCAY